jgi:hypothetical protein
LKKEAPEATTFECYCQKNLTYSLTMKISTSFLLAVFAAALSSTANAFVVTTPAAFTARRGTAVVLAAGPASSKEEDIELTIKVIQEFVGAESSSSQAAPAPVEAAAPAAAPAPAPAPKKKKGKKAKAE